MTLSVAAIVLAAGQSTRMGPQTNKLLEDLAGKPLIERPIAAVTQAGIAPVVVVTGFEAERVEAALQGRAVRCVRNPEWRAGMAKSIGVGAAHLFAETEVDEIDAVMILLGDLPDLDVAVVKRMLDAYRELTEAIPPADALLAAAAKGRRGHPVLFGRRYFPELAALKEAQTSGRATEGAAVTSSDASPRDEGARAVIERHRDRLRLVEFDSDSIHRDIDCPEDLSRERERHRPEEPR